jgi:hypothetical protein
VRAGLRRVAGICLCQRVCALWPVVEAVAARPVDVVVVVERTLRVQQGAANLLILVAVVIGVLRLSASLRESSHGQRTGA